MFYRLSRFSGAHRMLRHVAYAILWRTPRSIKEGCLHFYLRRRLPYRLVRQGDTVIQIGAPWDIAKSGRSRFIHFLRRVGPDGRVVVIEPDEENVAYLRHYAHQYAIKNLTIVPKGAWNSKARLRFMRDPENPASNLVQEVFDSERSDSDRFAASEIEVDRLDNIAVELGLDQIRLVSVTTNGAENQIFDGMSGIQNNVSYVATIGDSGLYPKLQSYGYEQFGGDDRGFTFARSTG